MKLDLIERKHVLKAADYIDINGIPSQYLYNNYWVQLPNKKEYPFKYLIRVAYQLISGTWLEFQSNEGYRGYVENKLDFPVIYYKEDINFITKEDIDTFETIGGNKYRKNISGDVMAAKQIKPLVYKLNKWAINSVIEDFVPRLDYGWQWSGTIKQYLWIRIHRKSSSKKVFFTLGVSLNEGLFVKIDCLRSNFIKSGCLSKEQQNNFDDYLHHTDIVNISLSKQSIINYNWDKLINETVNYFHKYKSLYDELENIISPPSSEVKNEESRFLQVDSPNKTKTYVKTERLFKGKDLNWSRKYSISSFLGKTGEDLVIEFEKLKLNNAGLFEKEKLVAKQRDGCGYDIISFDNSGNEIHIEVKTTTGNKDEPFYFSINEREYFTKHPENYFLYRLFEFRINPYRTKYFVLTPEDLIRKAEFNATSFEVSIVS